MAIHRMKKKTGYSVIDNSIIRGKGLSATAKMVLIVALSLPDDWKFNIHGLCTFCKEGPDAVGRAIKELEKAGYVKRQRIRKNGIIIGMKYDIYECPQRKNRPVTEIPGVDDSETGNPDMDSPNQDQQVLPITELPIKEVPNNNTTDNLSTNQTDASEDRIRNQIEYDVMCQRYDRRLLDDIVSVMVSAMIVKGNAISVRKGAEYPVEYVRCRLERVNAMHIEQIMETMIRKSPTIRNVRAYLLTALINSVNTMEMGYQYGEDWE